MPLRQSLVIIAKIIIRLLCSPRIRIIWHSVKQNTGINVEAAVVVINIILMMNKFSSCVRSFQQMLRTDSDLVDKIKATCLLTLNSNQLPPHTHVCTVGKNPKKVCNFFLHLDWSLGKNYGNFIVSTFNTLNFFCIFIVHCVKAEICVNWN